MIMTDFVEFKGERMSERSPFKVFELYSGIGGMHCALADSKCFSKFSAAGIICCPLMPACGKLAKSLESLQNICCKILKKKECGVQASVEKAIDINPMANAVYKHNFPNVTLLERNIQGLVADEFNKIKIDIIVMSPPCQPFSRNGLRRDVLDERNLSLLHIINLIPQLDTVRYILLENVQGFEISEMRNQLISSLEKSNFVYQELMLSPDQFFIPNSRLRYYLLAKKLPQDFCFTRKSEIVRELPQAQELQVAEKIDTMNLKFQKLTLGQTCFEVKSILENADKAFDFLSDELLKKYGSLLDIVTSTSVKTCCFTKAYGRFVEGTGSVFTPLSERDLEQTLKQLEQVEKGSKEFIELMKSLKLRYFSPEEICKLMCFPKNFKFPNHFTNRQKYKLLGNSINVHVVSLLLVLLVS